MLKSILSMDASDWPDCTYCAESNSGSPQSVRGEMSFHGPLPPAGGPAVTHADGPSALPVTGALVDGAPADALADGDGVLTGGRDEDCCPAEEQATRAVATRRLPTAIPSQAQIRRRSGRGPGPPSQAIKGTPNRVCRESPRRVMSSFSSLQQSIGRGRLPPSDATGSWTRRSRVAQVPMCDGTCSAFPSQRSTSSVIHAWRRRSLSRSPEAGAPDIGIPSPEPAPGPVTASSAPTNPVAPLLPAPTPPSAKPPSMPSPRPPAPVPIIPSGPTTALPPAGSPTKSSPIMPWPPGPVPPAPTGSPIPPAPPGRLPTGTGSAPSPGTPPR